MPGNGPVVPGILLFSAEEVHPVSGSSRLAVAFLFAAGTAFGSFLNVLAWRLPRGESLLWPPSRCPSCGRRLATRDLVPVLSWVLLGGRCRYCGAGIHWRYPLVELLSGLSLVVPYVLVGPYLRALFLGLAGLFLCCVLAFMLAERGFPGGLQRVNSTF